MLLYQLPLLPVCCCYSSLARFPACLEALLEVLPFNLCLSGLGSSRTADSANVHEFSLPNSPASFVV